MTRKQLNININILNDLKLLETNSLIENYIQIKIRDDKK